MGKSVKENNSKPFKTTATKRKTKAELEERIFELEQALEKYQQATPAKSRLKGSGSFGSRLRYYLGRKMNGYGISIEKHDSSTSG